MGPWQIFSLEIAKVLLSWPPILFATVLLILIKGKTLISKGIEQGVSLAIGKEGVRVIVLPPEKPEIESLPSPVERPPKEQTAPVRRSES
jgi:hypothetical protein